MISIRSRMNTSTKHGHMRILRRPNTSIRGKAEVVEMSMTTNKIAEMLNALLTLMSCKNYVRYPRTKVAPASCCPADMNTAVNVLFALLPFQHCHTAGPLRWAASFSAELKRVSSESRSTSISRNSSQLLPYILWRAFRASFCRPFLRSQ